MPHGGIAVLILNPPLRVGQQLEPRPGRKVGPSKLIGFTIGPAGLLWQIQNNAGDVLTVPLSLVYRMFKFEGQTDEDLI